MPVKFLFPADLAEKRRIFILKLNRYANPSADGCLVSVMPPYFSFVFCNPVFQRYISEDQRYLREYFI